MDHLRALRVLGLPPGASADEIRAARLDLARVWHPDRFQQDERLLKKANDQLAKINEAFDALADYDPSVAPSLAARMRESVAIVLQAPFTPSAPIGLRHSLRVLGLGNRRLTGEVGARRTRRAPLLALVLLLALAGLVVLWLLRR